MPAPRSIRGKGENVALTRKMLKAMGIEDEKVEQIIEEHVESVDGLKAERDRYKGGVPRRPRACASSSRRLRPPASSPATDVVVSVSSPRLTAARTQSS